VPPFRDDTRRRAAAEKGEDAKRDAKEIASEAEAEAEGRQKFGRQVGGIQGRVRKPAFFLSSKIEPCTRGVVGRRRKLYDV
jgi:hypothetical protein